MEATPPCTGYTQGSGREIDLTTPTRNRSGILQRQGVKTPREIAENVFDGGYYRPDSWIDIQAKDLEELIQSIQAEAWAAGMNDAKAICATVDSDLVSGMDTAKECEMRIESTIYARSQHA